MAQRVEILGVGVSVTTMSGAVDQIGHWIKQGARHYVCVTNIHGVTESLRDPILRAIHNRSGLTVPDGVPMVWCGRLAGAQGMKLVRGPDLLPAVCSEAARQGWTNYFYGAAEGTAERLGEALARRYPGLHIVGTDSPPFRPLTRKEDEEAVLRINTVSPDIVWVGLSTPKQERWMAEHIDRLDAKVLVGVGAAFDIHAGVVKGAPAWICGTGLEWLYRMFREPRRLWRRYRVAIPRFGLGVLRDRPRLVDESDLLV